MQRKAKSHPDELHQEPGLYKWARRWRDELTLVTSNHPSIVAHRHVWVVSPQEAARLAHKNKKHIFNLNGPGRTIEKNKPCPRKLCICTHHKRVGLHGWSVHKEEGNIYGQERPAYSSLRPRKSCGPLPHPAHTPIMAHRHAWMECQQIEQMSVNKGASKKLQ